MNWLEPLDNYCERTDASLWAEPLNAATNLAFILAGIAAVRLYMNQRRGGQPHSPALLALTALVFLVGLGSALFHTAATRWAMLADVIPILLFMYLYQGVFVRRALGFSGWMTALYLAAFYGVSQSMGLIFGEEALNGSIFYIPAAAALAGFALWTSRARMPGAAEMLLAGGIFMLSLVFRTLDREVCAAFPAGTHFLWHILNGAVLYLLLRGLFPLMRRP